MKAPDEPDKVLLVYPFKEGVVKTVNAERAEGIEPLMDEAERLDDFYSARVPPARYQRLYYEGAFVQAEDGISSL